jgi:hypothetical protein
MKLNLDKLVRGGLPPWRPCEAAGDMEVWHRYDFPMAGTYKLQNHLILFTVIGDTSQSLSVWAYIPVTGADEDRVACAEFASPSEMRVFIEGMFAGKEAAFALAKDLSVWKWARQQVPPREDGLIQAATAALAEMVKAITEKRKPPGPDVIFRAELAQAGVTTDDLVDA